MGFGKWLKNALKPPKALRKLKLGKAVGNAFLGLVTGGQLGKSVLQSVQESQAQIQADAERRREEEMYAATIPMPGPSRSALQRTYESGSLEATVTRQPVILLVGLVGVIVVVTLLLRRR